MEYYRITSIQDPFFKQLHQLMQECIPSRRSARI